MKPTWITYDQAAKFKSIAARDRVSVSNTADTDWVAYMQNDRIIALAGLMRRNSYWRIKGVWVQPEFRGNSLGTTLTEWLIDYAQSHGALKVDAYAWNPDWYLSRGFAATGTNAHGATRVAL